MRQHGRQPTTYLEGPFMRLLEALFLVAGLGKHQHAARSSLNDS